MYKRQEGTKLPSAAAAIYTVTSTVATNTVIPTAAANGELGSWADMALMQITIKPVSGPPAQRFIHIAKLEK